MNFALNCAEKTAISQSSLADVFNSIEPSLPESLFGEDCRRRMRCVAARFPMQLSNFWGFECRLGELERSSDILFEIRKGNPGPVFLAGGEKNPSGIDELCEAGLTWQKLRAFAQNWTNPTHPWNHDIRNLWLEMDLVGGDVQKALSRPNIFFGPDLKISYERTLELIGELAPMFGRPVSQTYALREFFDCLPEGARVFQIGFMLNRADDAGIRLCVDKVMEDTETEKIMSWLAKLYSTTRTGPIGAAEIGSLRRFLKQLLRFAVI